MKNVRRLLFWLLTVVTVFQTASALAYIPEPKSEGRFVIGKGTRTEEEYEARAGAPLYDYLGKGIELGPVHVKPNADYRLSWTDNVFYEEDNKQSDYVNRVYTDVRAELPLNAGQHLLSGAYITNSEFFNRFDSQDHTDHLVRGNLDLNFVPFTFNIEDTFERTEERSNTEFTNRIERYENVLHTLLEVPFAQFFVENEIIDFNEDYRATVFDDLDYNDFGTYQRVGYELTPATQILLEHAYRLFNYDNDSRDGDANQFMVGLRGFLTERLSYQVWVGPQFRVYDDDARPDFNGGFVYRSSLSFQQDETSMWTLKSDRQPEESTFDGQSFYVRNRTELFWRKQVAERIFLNTRGSFSYNEYSRVTVIRDFSRTRRDYVWGGGAGLEYVMPNDYISFLFEYRHDSRNSNMDGLDYHADTISGGVRVHF